MQKFLQVLADALKARIQRDMGSGGHFPAKGWEKIQLGQYYFSSDAMAALIAVHRVVGEVLNHTLLAFGRALPQSAWADFFKSITLTTTPEEALARMRTAAAVSVPQPHTIANLGGLSAPVSAGPMMSAAAPPKPKPPKKPSKPHQARKTKKAKKVR